MAPTILKTVHRTSLFHIESSLDRLGWFSPTHDQRSQQQSGLASRLHQLKASTTMDLRISIFLIFVRCVALRNLDLLIKTGSSVVCPAVMDGRNINLKQLQQTTARCFPCTVESVQPTPASSTTKLSSKTLTTSPREHALRLFPIGTTVAKESGSKTLSGQMYDYHVPHWRVQYEDND